MERTYTCKFRLYPSKGRREYLANVFGRCRFVYNYFLSEKKKRYEESKKSDSYYTQSSELNNLRKIDNFGFLNAVPPQSLQCGLRNMHTAYGNFYKHKKQYPKSKSKKGKQSFKIAQPNAFKNEDDRLYIPELKNGIYIVVSKEVVGKICFATIPKNKAGGYYMATTVKQEYEPYKKIKPFLSFKSDAFRVRLC